MPEWLLKIYKGASKLPKVVDNTIKLKDIGKRTLEIGMRINPSPNRNLSDIRYLWDNRQYILTGNGELFPNIKGSGWDNLSMKYYTGTNSPDVDLIKTYIYGDKPNKLIDVTDNYSLGRHRFDIENNKRDNARKTLIKTYQTFPEQISQDIANRLNEASYNGVGVRLEAHSNIPMIRSKGYRVNRPKENYSKINTTGHNIELTKDPETGILYARRSDFWHFRPKNMQENWTASRIASNIIDKGGMPFIIRSNWTPVFNKDGQLRSIFRRSSDDFRPGFGNFEWTTDFNTKEMEKMGINIIHYPNGPKLHRKGGVLKAQPGAIIKTAGKAIKTLSKPKGIAKSLFTVAPLAQVQSDAGQVVNSTFNNWRLNTFGQEALSKPVTYEELNSFVNLLDASKSPYYSNLVKNFNKYGKGLMVKDTYHDALSPQELLEEMTFMAIPERPFNQDLSLVNEYYSTDVLPRLLKNIKDEGVTLTPEQTKYITEMYSNPANGVDMKFSYMPKGWGGYSSGNNSIRYSYRYYPTEIVDNGTIVHELHHSLRDRLKSYLSSQGYTNFAPTFDSEGFLLPQVEDLPENLLSKSSYRNSDIWGQYTPKEITLMEPLAMTKENSSDKTPIAEIAAVTAGNARFNTWMNLKEKLGRTPSISEINTKIDNFDPLKLYTNFSNLPYGNQIGSLGHAKVYEDIGQIHRKTNLYNLISKSRYKALPFYKKWFVPRPTPKVANTGPMFTDFQNKYAKSLKEAMKGIAGFTGVEVGLSNINNDD